ncbi:MAG: hypothetical protein J0I12_01940 [Candidatus Eremiobacteraeota bacterium]|nr:hypothetical protein [Candidatus Eremiobacteraeota bacterium]
MRPAGAVLVLTGCRSAPEAI